MILYHGSSSKFEAFEINDNFLKTNVDNLMEGKGIYLTPDYNVAKDYGQYVYEVEINESDVSDFTDEQEILNIIEKLGQIVNINFDDYINIYDIIDMIIRGDLSVTKMYREINLLLDSNESFYIDFEEDTEQILDSIKNNYKNLLTDILKYNDKSLGIVYICIRNEQNLKIKGLIKESRLLKLKKEAKI